MNHRGVTDLEFVLDRQAALMRPGDDRLLRLDMAMPAAGGRQIQAARQFAIAVHFAGDHELPAHRECRPRTRIPRR